MDIPCEKPRRESIMMRPAFWVLSLALLTRLGGPAGPPGAAQSRPKVVRPYWLVDDIEAALAAAVEAGGEVAHPPMEIPGHGTFAICIHGDIHHRLWTL